MSFIGIISDNKSFENIRKKILENIKDSKLNIININRQSIENIQNIKFKIIVIDNNLEKFKNQKSTLQKICKKGADTHKIHTALSKTYFRNQSTCQRS